MKVGDLVKRCPRYWHAIPELPDDKRGQVGIIVQHDIGPKWSQLQEYFVVMWSDGAGLDWKEPYSLEVINESR